MFEEVPRTRRGLAGLSARRVAFGPFVIGGGVLVAALGGSVAVAATVITATTIATDVPAKRAAAPAAQPARPPAGQPGISGTFSHPLTSFVIPSAPGSAASNPRRTIGKPAQPNLPTASSTQPPPVLPTPLPSISSRANRSRSSASPTTSGTPTVSPSPTSSGPVGNALIFITGYDRVSSRLVYQFAREQSGAGPGGTDWYSVQSPATFSAAVGAHISITSGGQLCPPAGSSCTVAQLIAGSADGFFANAAIDPLGQLDSVVELDNATTGAGINPPSPTPTSSPSTVAPPSAVTPAG